MKTHLAFCFNLLIGLSLSHITHAQQHLLAGTWLLPESGIRLTLSAPNVEGYGQYSIQYTNGFSNQNTYLVQNNSITFAAFNYGQDQAFNITLLNEQQLGLQSYNPPQQIVLQRENSGNTYITNQISTINNNGQVLASSGGYQLTEGHWQAVLQFAEFVLGTTLPPAEKQAFQQALIQDFQSTPQASIQEIENLSAQMQQFYQLTDISQIALSRNMLLAALYQELSSMPEKPYFYKLMQKYAAILSIDPATGLALTWRDVDGFISMMSFYYELAGQSLQLSEQDRQAYAQYLSQQFAMADPQTKATLCIMSTLNEYMRAAYAQLSPAEQQQVAAQLLQSIGTSYQQGYANTSDPYQQQYQYPQTNYPANTPTNNEAIIQQMQQEMQLNDFMFNTMNNIMLEQHATSLNIIENMGSSNSYWEVVDY